MDAVPPGQQLTRMSWPQRYDEVESAERQVRWKKNVVFNDDPEADEYPRYFDSIAEKEEKLALAAFDDESVFSDLRATISRAIHQMKAFFKRGVDAKALDEDPTFDAADGGWAQDEAEVPPLQAEEALCPHGTFLDGGNPSVGDGVAIDASGRNDPLIIVGVMRMDAGVARRLSLAGPEGGVAPPRVSGGRPVIGNKIAKTLLSEEDILLGGSGGAAGSGSVAAGRPGSVCDKVLGWIFMW